MTSPLQVPPTSAIADVLALLGLPGLIDAGLSPVTPMPRQVVGPAATVELIDEPGSLAGVHDMVSRDLSGHVVVVAGANASPGAVWGQILSCASSSRGAIGAVVDGPVRDRDSLAGEDLPVWGGRRCSVGPSGRVRVRALDRPVSVGGALVCPGDLVVLDADGVVVLDARFAERVVELAGVYEDAESKVLGALRRGQRLSDVYRWKQEAVERIIAAPLDQ